jgi:hypothetical protein
MAHRWATKFRLPKVPPGARLRLKYSVRPPYAWTSALPAATSVTSAAARSAAVASPARAAARALQKSAAPARLTPSARTASHPLGASAALAAESARKAASARSTPRSRCPASPLAPGRRFPTAAASAAAAASCRATSLGTKNRSSSNSLYGSAARATATPPPTKARAAPAGARPASGRETGSAERARGGGRVGGAAGYGGADTRTTRAAGCRQATGRSRRRGGRGAGRGAAAAVGQRPPAAGSPGTAARTEGSVEPVGRAVMNLLRRGRTSGRRPPSGHRATTRRRLPIRPPPDRAVNACRSRGSGGGARGATPSIRSASHRSDGARACDDAVPPRPRADALSLTRRRPRVPTIHHEQPSRRPPEWSDDVPRGPTGVGRGIGPCAGRDVWRATRRPGSPQRPTTLAPGFARAAACPAAPRPSRGRVEVRQQGCRRCPVRLSGTAWHWPARRSWRW